MLLFVVVLFIVSYSLINVCSMLFDVVYCSLFVVCSLLIIDLMLRAI